MSTQEDEMPALLPPSGAAKSGPPSTIAAYEFDGGDETISETVNRKWIGTCYRYEELSNEEFLKKWQDFFGKNLRFVAWGRETCPSTGRFHYQWFAHFNQPVMQGRKLKRGDKGKFNAGSLNDFCRMYSAIQRGNLSQNEVYSSKQSSLFSWGVPCAEEGKGNGRGKRNDLDEACEDIVDRQMTKCQMMMTRPSMMVKFGRGFSDLMNMVHPHRSGKPETVWVYGASGAGKSEFAETVHGRENVYRKPNGTMYFNDYEHQEAVVLEEFRLYSQTNPRGWHFTDFLQVLDRYPLSIEVKGSSAKFDSPFVYITSIWHPEKYFPDWAELKQVLRRLDRIFEANGDGTYSIDEQYAEHLFDPFRAPTKVVVPDDFQRLVVSRREKEQFEKDQRLKEGQMRSAVRALALQGKTGPLSVKQEDEQ